MKLNDGEFYYYSGKISPTVFPNIPIVRWFEQKYYEYRGWKESKRLQEMGFIVFCPHTNSFGVKKTWGEFMRTDLAILEHCNAIIMGTGWQSSRGACEELNYAKLRGLDVYYL